MYDPNEIVAEYPIRVGLMTGHVVNFLTVKGTFDSTNEVRDFASKEEAQAWIDSHDWPHNPDVRVFGGPVTRRERDSWCG